MKMKSEVMAVRRTRKGRCMQTTKGTRHERVGFKKLRQKSVNETTKRKQTVNTIQAISLTAVQKNGNSVLVEDYGVQHRQNVTQM